MKDINSKHDDDLFDDLYRDYEDSTGQSPDLDRIADEVVNAQENKQNTATGNDNQYYNDGSPFDDSEGINNTKEEVVDNMPTPNRRRRHQEHPVGRLVGKVFGWMVLLGVIGLAVGIGLFAYYAKDAPTISEAKLISGGSSTFYTQDGKLLLSLGSENRNYLKSSQIPQDLKDAVISIEDKRFYHEPLGVDPIRIIGSAAKNLHGNDISAGGSTITQQLIKLSVFSTAASQRTLRRKCQEAWLAMRISREYSKDQVLEFYINKVYMGYNQYGIGTAAQYYYGKSIKDLDLAQVALLAGMPNAPTSFDPYLYPDQAKYRRDLVLQAMYNNGKITGDQLHHYKAEPIDHGLRPRHVDDNNPYLKIDDPYIKEAIEEVKSDGFDPFHNNLKITVNIDQDVQDKLYELANSKKIPFTDNKMQVGATIIDPKNGHVVAIIGGRHLNPNVRLGLDRAVLTNRSTGSSIKPILDYGPAIEYMNWSTAQTVQDTPYTYAGTNIQLYDWDNRYMGPMTMRYALEQSRNVPAVRTLEAVGMRKAIGFAKQMGVKVNRDAGLSVAIGANASSLQMTGAYAAIANQGIYHKPQFVSKIQTPDGITYSYDNSGTRVMKPSTAYMLTDMLKGVISKGSGTQAQIKGLHQAGKTGTVKYSGDELVKFPSYRGTPKDSWFCGYTRSYAMGIWTGYDTLRDGKIAGQGQNAAQILYKDMMTYLMKDKENLDWDKPETVIQQQYLGGTAPSEELYVKGHAPKAPKKPTKKKEDNNRNTIQTVPKYYRRPTQPQDRRYYYYRRPGTTYYYYYYR